MCVDLTPDSTCETNQCEFNYRLGGASPEAYFVQLRPPKGYE